METDQFIDHAVMNGQTMVYLIHGKGTGALRKAIHAHLRGHRNVKSFRLGQYGEGEARCDRGGAEISRIKTMNKSAGRSLPKREAAPALCLKRLGD